jgi:hypothetical protein
MHLTLQPDELDLRLGVRRAGLAEPAILAGQRVAAGVDDYPERAVGPFLDVSQ